MVDKIKSQANIPNSPACGQWETLLVDAMDGLLKPEDEAIFSGHMATCASCAEMFEQVRRGREWLEFLAPEPVVPAYLLDKILVETGHGKMDPSKLVVAGGPAAVVGGNVLTMPPAWQRPGFKASMRRFAEPRLLMTAAMAFFSIALTLSMTGIRITGIKMADLRPAAVRSQLEKRIMTASTPIVRYYDHLRFVYEVESTMRQLRQSSENQQNQQPSQPAKQAPGGTGDGVSHRKDGGSKLNPSNAPQQTVNPPHPLWGGETEEARLELPAASAPVLNSGFIEASFQVNKGFPTHTEASGSIPSGRFEAERIATGSTETNVLAMPERSTSCIA